MSLKRTRSAMMIGTAGASGGADSPTSLSVCVSHLTLTDVDLKETALPTTTNSTTNSVRPDLTIVTNPTTTTVVPAIIAAAPAPLVVEEPEAPLVLSSFKVVSTLRQTIYGSVQCVEDSKGVKLALKKSKRADVAKLNTLENPSAEMEVLKVLKPHPNVIRCYGAGADSQWDFTVLELCDGGDLFDVLERSGKLADERARTIFAQVAGGLRHVHESGYAHLDVSPENILMKGEHAKLCDFGMSRRLCPKFAASKHEKPGKLAYMAPEIYALSEFNGEQADVWSLGVVLFIMLTGFPPYRFPNDTDPRFRMIYNGRIARLLELSGVSVSTIPQAAMNLMERMLAPAHKRISMQDVLAHAWLRDM